MRNRRNVVIVLMVLTLLMGAGALFIAFRIGQNQAPPSGNAAVPDCTSDLDCTVANASYQCSNGTAILTCCPPGQKNVNGSCSTISNCSSGLSCGGTIVSGASACLNGSTVAYCCPSGQTYNSVGCSTVCQRCDGTGDTKCTGLVPGQIPTGFSCTCGYSGNATQCGCSCTGGSTSSSGTTSSSSSSSGGSTTGDCSDWCATSAQCSASGGNIVGRRCSGGTCTSGTSPCLVGSTSSSGGSSSSGSVASQFNCGAACSSDSQCKSQAANGATVKCINGQCSNVNCPTATIPGANCDCSTLNSCGHQCSGSLGLCQAGTTCTFVNLPQCNDISGNYTYCVPDSVYNSLPSCRLTSSTNTTDNLLMVPSGQSVSTYLANICNPTVTCYRCTGLGSDGNACESFTVAGTSCPTGTSSAATGCAAAMGGSCPIVTTASCGEACDANTLCNTGMTCSAGKCVLTASLTTPARYINGCTVLPVTGIFDDKTDSLLFGFFALVLGIIALRYQLLSKSIAYLGDFRRELELTTQRKVQERKNKTRKEKMNKIKEDREDFESKFRS